MNDWNRDIADRLCKSLENIAKAQEKTNVQIAILGLLISIAALALVSVLR